MAISLTAGTFRALVFDCDGTLVDSAPAHLGALQKAMEPLGLTMTADWYYPRVGLGPDALLDAFEDHVNRKSLPRGEILARYDAAFKRCLPLVREVAVIAEVARAWHGRVPMAVASNGHRENVAATLSVAGLLPLFNLIVGAEDVKYGKPAPDVYLEAARRMKVAPEECIAFEDSDEGLKAARTAGMRTIDIREHFTPVR
ncbi:haloacid dehalogenase [Edaphobacter acidisoli]|uniref:Haloacid dehalogenase n=1 Tax=Edaphobacter acidisoli TaxID=2040573 RepID=A0A916VZT2_9BACT|nr:HAD family phosphatase [Edaphobacter acidisoli]GGA55829.1 haloacid dehalogenase [Edaphobacter acidisoli]